MSEPKCPSCHGFGYTKGGPAGPWDKVDCGRCTKPHVQAVTSKNKAIVLFWLSRHLRQLESMVEGVKHVDMAEAGLSYSQRSASLEALDSARDATKVQIESVKAAIRYIEESVR
jgi:hypothetical protein